MRIMKGTLMKCIKVEIIKSTFLCHEGIKLGLNGRYLKYPIIFGNYTHFL